MSSFSIKDEDYFENSWIRSLLVYSGEEKDGKEDEDLLTMETMLMAN